MTDQDFRPRLIVLASPNGAGKSTFHDVFLASLGFPFVNADHALAAARLAHEERLALIERRENFIMETVFSDTGGHKLAFFRNARDSGYVIEAHFIGLANAAP